MTDATDKSDRELIEAIRQGDDAALEVAFQEHDYLFLTTSTDVALRFYLRLGFDEVGYITDMHAPGNNEHLLRKMKG